MKLSNLLMLIFIFLLNNNITKCHAFNKKQISIIFFEIKSSTNINENDINYLYNLIKEKLDRYNQLFIFNYKEIDSLINVYDINIVEPFDNTKRRELGMRIGAEKYLKCFITDFTEDSTSIDIYIGSCLFEENPKFVKSFKFNSDKKSIKHVAQKAKNEVLYYLLPDLRKRRIGKCLLMCALTVKLGIIYYLLLNSTEKKGNLEELPDPPKFPFINKRLSYLSFN